MTRSQKVAVLWFLGGAAFLVAGLITEPRRPLTIGVGILFFVVGIVSITRDRRSPSPPAT
jgi:hypothetical protein